MSEQPTESPRERHLPEPPAMPGWVPTVIGVVLVLMAGLAVYTGLRFRNRPLAGSIIRMHHPPGPMAAGPPGEPEPGSSLLFPDHAPSATETAAANAVRMSARRGLITNVLPDDAMIYINGLAIGEAKQFNTLEEVYDFPAPGDYTVRVISPGYREQQYVITADDDAAQEIARIDLKMVRE